MKLNELKQARAAAVTEMRSLADTAEKETRDLTETEAARFDTLKGEVESLDKKIERAEALAAAERRAPAIVHAGNLGDGSYEERAHQFSVTKAINAAAGDTSVDVGFEREISQEVAFRTGRKFVGIAVPDEIFYERRDLSPMTIGTSQAPGAAFNLYPTQHRADLFVDMLRSKIVTGRLGATILDGLVGDQEIPKQTGSATAQWLGEDGELSDSNLSFTDVELKPKTVGALTSYSRRTMLNATPSIERLVRNDLAAIVANAIDREAMLGDGESNHPLGVVNQSDVHQIDLSEGATWEKVLDFIASIQNADADVGSFGWAVSPDVVKKLRATPRDADNGGEGFIMESPSMLAGYAAASTTALRHEDESSPPVPLGRLIFGVWSQILIGKWSGLDLLVNPYADSVYSKGRVMIRVLQDLDVAVRHGEAFAFADDMPVATGGE